MQTNRLGYFESIRGVAAVLVMLRHFRSAFYPYASFGNFPTFESIPHSPVENFLSETSLGLMASFNFAFPLFFVLSGFVLSFKLIGKRDVRSRILGSTSKRPVRLVGMVWFSMILAYGLQRLGWYFNDEIASLTTSVPWFQYYWTGRVPSITVFLIDLFFRPFSRGGLYNQPLWMMSVELSGSILTFAYLFLVGDRRWRLAILLPSIVFFWVTGTYHVGFALGILCGEIAKFVSERGIKIHWTVPVILLALGWIVGSYPLVSSMEVHSQTIFAILPYIDFFQGYHVLGGAMILLAAILSPTLQARLNGDWFRSLGHVSYSIFTLHFIVLGSFSSFLYYMLYPRMGHHGAAWISIGLSIPLILLLAKYAARYVDDNVSRLADWIGQRGERFFAFIATRASTWKSVRQLEE
ncbi:MAG: acyltransferase [Anaerolineaceae bacterium]|nr:MAG: acyltransferase [Anaerolineaceae bacterium]